MSKIEVVGAGLGRTGTLSTKTALDILGYRTYHMTEAFSPQKKKIITKSGERFAYPLDIWADAMDQKNQSGMIDPNYLEGVLHGYTATVDYPACVAFDDLIRMNPDAKVILTVRDPESWLRSFKDTIGYYFYHTWGNIGDLLFVSLVPFLRGMRRMVGPMMDYTTFKQVWKVKGFSRNEKGLEETTQPLSFCDDLSLSDKDDQRMIQSFEEWNEYVKKVVKKESLLIFNVKEGWEPLCHFLGKPVPQVPFPNVNDTKSFSNRRKLMNTVAVVLTSSIVAVVAAIAHRFLL